MAMLTLADARALLFESFSVGDNDPHPDLAAVGVAGVYDVELPGGDMAKPLAVSLWSPGYGPTEFNFEVRVYASTDEGVGEAQHYLDAVLPVLDYLLPGRGWALSWDIVYASDLGAIVASSPTSVGREDF